MNISPSPGDATGRPRGWHQRLRTAHFHDYNAAAFTMWLAITLSGAAAMGWSLLALSNAAAASLAAPIVALLLVAMAAWFPIEVPRSKYSLSAADAFIFAALAMLGTPAAVLAAGVDVTIGGARSQQRLASRFSTPAAAMAAMLVCGLVFHAVETALTSIGWSLPEAKLASLVLVSLIHFMLTTLPLLATITLKRGHWPDVREWLRDYSGVGAMFVVSSLVAGMVQFIVADHGLSAVGIVALTVLGVVLLMRKSIAKTEGEHLAQEARISEAQREAELNQRRFAAAFADAVIGMAIVEQGGDILRANKAFCTLFRHAEADLKGRPLSRVLHPGDVERFGSQALEVGSREDLSASSIELRCFDVEGNMLWVELHCGRFSDLGSAAVGLIYQVHDITSRRTAENRLHHIAYHDDLTDLANRACFQEKLALAVSASSVDEALGFAVVVLDLDRFKVINDSLGHLVGNQLLREVGRRLAEAVRPADLVARLGGDEFAVLLHGARDPEHGMRMAARLLAAIGMPLMLGGNEVATSASIGITFSQLGQRSVDELLRDADLAMYEAKAAGRGCVAVFDRTMHERIADKLSLEADLRRALGEGGLSLAFQPLFELTPYRLVGFEALARWNHPVRGPIGPAIFIGIAEEAGHIEALTAWALETALAQLAAWHRAAPHMAHLSVNVNISGRDLARTGFVERVLGMLQTHGVDAGRLTLEITESVLMGNLGVALDTLARLREAGVQLAIDDFGTGYSSLAYLSTLPIDCLKIDRSFVVAMDRGAENIEIVRAVLTLGRALGKKVVAEGIETPEQLDTLRRLGVHVGQGYLLARPLRPEQIPALLYAPAEAPLTV